jgi:putative ABC transport system permease protein
MLELKNIVKIYKTSSLEKTALNGISLQFQSGELVAILGPSGCGKTTLLNIIGGLDQYTSGDLIINGKSTKDFRDADWDRYRNHSIGFVFQSYNLINHLSVLDNVELGLTLSGIGPAEKRQIALDVLKRVGLEDQVSKKPNQLSGGQLQRVAIARALANNPDIILADEPTGALDSKTSIQILELIKEISSDKLVILVTHNSVLAHKYANRIIELSDGEIMSDTGNGTGNTENERCYQPTTTSMSFWTALKLSFNNMRTKLVRTMITAFAGSIGIIGVALVLSIANGFTHEIDKIQKDALAGLPIAVSEQVYIVTEDMLRQRMNQETETDFSVIHLRVNPNITNNTITNDYLDFINRMDPAIYESKGFKYKVKLNLLQKNNDAITAVPANRTRNIGVLPDNMDYLMTQFTLISGKMPTSYNEMVLILDNNNRIGKNAIEALGIEATETIAFDQVIGKQFFLAKNDDFYMETTNGLFRENSDLTVAYRNGYAISVVGIIKANGDFSNMMLSDTMGMQTVSIGYLPVLNDMYLEDCQGSDIAKAQEEKMVNVLRGTNLTEEEKMVALQELGAMKIPSEIKIYASDFKKKEQIRNYLDSYNIGKEDGDKVIYSDLAATYTSVMGTIIDNISIVLIAFASISLVVSSIMIGIITYISVLERTKEIGILRSLGARKKDIARVFNAETIIIGFASGVFGVLVTVIINITLNDYLISLADGMTNIASLSSLHAVLLVIVSMILTLIAGLIPSGIAAKKDPVQALRVE